MNSRELWAMTWLYWIAGQRGARADFPYIFDHLCLGKKGWDHNGLDHAFYRDHLFVIQQANDMARDLAPFLERPNVACLTTDAKVKASLRFYGEGPEVLVMATNAATSGVGKTGVLISPFLGGAKFERVGEPGTTTVTPEGYLVDDFDSYRVRLYRRVL